VIHVIARLHPTPDHDASRFGAARDPSWVHSLPLGDRTADKAVASVLCAQAHYNSQQDSPVAGGMAHTARPMLVFGTTGGGNWLCGMAKVVDV
jgi:hypothetical protein